MYVDINLHFRQVSKYKKERALTCLLHSDRSKTVAEVVIVIFNYFEIRNKPETSIATFPVKFTFLFLMPVKVLDLLY